MSVLQQQSPSQLGPGRRRPGMTEFDSLQDLLEQAGYKDTRVFSPIAIHIPSSSSSAHNASELAPDQQPSTSQGGDVTKSSHWFSTLWPSASNNRKDTLNRKQSEPVLTQKGRKAVQRGWMGAWGSSSRSGSREDTPAVPPLPSTFQASNVELNDVDPLPPPPQRQPLCHATSTNNLWKGSMQHHRSFPAKLREQHTQGKSVARKESFDGAGVVAGVGVGATKTVANELLLKSREDQRVSLRQAFDQGGKEKRQEESSKPSQHNIHDSVSSLIDLQEVNAKNETPAKEVKTSKSAAPIPSAASLFSVAATPLLSRQEAVAMRNVDCLDFAGMEHNKDFRRPSSSKGLRKMRSVDALELALARMETLRQSSSRTPFQKHATIPESFSTDSLTNEDLASANAITTVVGDHLLSEGQFEDAASFSGSVAEELVFRRSSTPRLVITSPTGMRSPQPLVLEGQEFEPRSISPRKLQTFRPIPSRASSRQGEFKLQKPEASGEAEFSTKRSTSKRRSRLVKSRGESTEETEQKLPTSKTAKKRTSKSCNDLRGSAARGATIESSKMSGSEQIRALQRNVLQRNVVQEIGHHQYAALLENTAVKVPFHQFDDDEDDPFRDFAAVTSRSTSSTTNHREIDSTTSDIDRKMSPIPFDHLKRRPLSSSTVANSTVILSNRQLKMESTLSRKKSGVGLACLVPETTISRPISPRTSSLLSQNNDENAPPITLLDSPTTAYVVKKRSSRIRLGQR